MTRLTRRDVLKATAAASTIFPLFTVAGTRASGQVLGANEKLRVGVAGIMGRGRSHVDEFLQIPNVQVACLIDPDSRLFRGHESSALRIARQWNPSACKTSASRWKTRVSMRSAWPPATTGTR